LNTIFNKGREEREEKEKKKKDLGDTPRLQ
jgi:hypothetical protein